MVTEPGVLEWQRNQKRSHDLALGRKDHFWPFQVSFPQETLQTIGKQRTSSRGQPERHKGETGLVHEKQSSVKPKRSPPKQQLAASILVPSQPGLSDGNKTAPKGEWREDLRTSAGHAESLLGSRRSYLFRTEWGRVTFSSSSLLISLPTGFCCCSIINWSSWYSEIHWARRLHSALVANGIF